MGGNVARMGGTRNVY